MGILPSDVLGVLPEMLPRVVVWLVDLFRRLCRHYYLTHPEAAASNVNSYREMWDSKDSGEEG